MTKIDQINKILEKQRNGTFCSVSWISDQKSKVKAGERAENTVLKMCTGTFMKGSSYTSRRKVIEAKEDKGEAYIDPDTGKEKLACRESFYEEIPGYDRKIFGRSKKDPTKQYLLLNPCANCKTKVTYYLNGDEISKKDLEAKGIMQPSYWKSSNEDPLHLTINVNNIFQINGKVVHSA